MIIGGKGRNLLIGGLGADVLAGMGEEDLLIAGHFMPGEHFQARQNTARDLLAAWQDPAPIADRTAALRDDLIPLVYDDEAADLLLGGAGVDWFLTDADVSRMDRILDADRPSPRRR